MVRNSLCHKQVYQRRTHRRTHGIPAPYLDTKIYPRGFWCAEYVLFRTRTWYSYVNIYGVPVLHSIPYLASQPMVVLLVSITLLSVIITQCDIISLMEYIHGNLLKHFHVHKETRKYIMSFFLNCRKNILQRLKRHIGRQRACIWVLQERFGIIGGLA